MIIQLIKEINWIFPHMVQDIPISRAPAFYMDAKTVGKTGYKSENLTKMTQSPYNSL